MTDPVVTRRRHERGSLYAETLAALALIGLAVLTAGSLLNQQPLAAGRIDTRRELLRAAEASLEAVRSGALPLASGAVAPLPITSDRPLTVTLTVSPLDRPGLYQVVAVARAPGRGRACVQRLETRVWRPV